MDPSRQIAFEQDVTTSPSTVQPESHSSGQWCWNGVRFFDELEARISNSHSTIRIEFYILADDPVGRRVRVGLVAAAQRNVSVRVLVDGLNSPGLESPFWLPLLEAGGSVCIFHSRWGPQFWIRDHRKLVVIDDGWASVGGFNVASNYAGDGLSTGWLDAALFLTGHAARVLAVDFDRMWLRATGSNFGQRQTREWVRPKPASLGTGFQLHLSGPGQFGRSLPSVLRRDLLKSDSAQLATAYFLPNSRLRSTLRSAARQGRRVQLLLPSKSDVPLARKAARCLYSRLLHAGVEIFEYIPQILHVKLYLFGTVAYIGSANLDIRSLRLNHELMVRITDQERVKEASAAFSEWLKSADRISAATWSASRSGWEKLNERLAFWLLARVDPFLTHQLTGSARQDR